VRNPNAITEPADLVGSRIPDWVDRAACAQADPEVFFPDSRPALSVQLLCFACPVRTECLAHAVADPSLDGVWGGTTQRQRRRLRRRTAA
jgi:WhiB family transcriptional regulator, redox-sensing transcriptional regulator